MIGLRQNYMLGSHRLSGAVSFSFGSISGYTVDLNIPAGSNFKDQAKTQYATVDGDAVKCVTDQSGNSNDATIAANNPTLTTQNGFRALSFSGTMLQILNLSLSKNFTVFMVGAFDPVTERVLLEHGPAPFPGVAGFGIYASGSVIINDGVNSYTGGPSTTPYGDSKLKCTVTYCASTKESLKVDEDGWRLLRVSNLTGSVSSTDVLHLNIGARQNGTIGGVFRLVRLIIYNRTLTDSERYSCQIALAQLYHLPYNTVPNSYNTLFTDDFVRANGSPGANYTAIGGGSFFSILNNKLRCTTNGSVFTKYLNFNTQHLGEHCKITVNAKMISSGVLLFGLSHYASSSLYYSAAVFNTGAIRLYQNGSQISTVGSQLSIAAINVNDEVVCVFERRANKYFLTVTNTTQGVSGSVEWCNENFTSQPLRNNFAVAAYSGTWDLSLWKAERNSVGGTQNTLILGDSLAAGSSASGMRARSAELIKRQTANNIEVAAWRAAQSSDFLEAIGSLSDFTNVNKVLLKIGMNDILQGVPLATYRSNMLAIVAAIEALGKTVVIGNISPSSALYDANIQSFNADLVTTFAGYTIIDCNVNKRDVALTQLYASMDSGDQIHWNNTGMAQEAADIIAGWPGILT